MHSIIKPDQALLRPLQLPALISFLQAEAFLAPSGFRANLDLLSTFWFAAGGQCRVFNVISDYASGDPQLLSNHMCVSLLGRISPVAILVRHKISPVAILIVPLISVFSASFFHSPCHGGSHWTNTFHGIQGQADSGRGRCFWMKAQMPPQLNPGFACRTVCTMRAKVSSILTRLGGQVQASVILAAKALKEFLANDSNCL
jgi:hypothetical protein